MSRTRIVKGKITERVKGDISIYSASNIIETSLQSIVEIGKEKGISFGQPKRPSSIETTEVERIEIEKLKEGSANDGTGKSIRLGMVYGEKYKLRVTKFKNNEEPISSMSIIWLVSYITEEGEVVFIKISQRGKEILYKADDLEACGRDITFYAYIKDRTKGGELMVFQHYRFRWFDREIIKEELKERMDKPWLADQNDTPTCGVAVILYVLAKNDFEKYQRFILTLHRTGIAVCNTYKINIAESKHLLEMNPIDPYYPQNVKKMPYIDWISFSSIRDKENEVRDFEGKSNEFVFDGSTLPKELVKMAKTILNFTEIIDYTNVVFIKDNLFGGGEFSSSRELAKMQKLYLEGYTIFMLINSNMLYNKKSGMFSTIEHWVVFEGLIESTISPDWYKFKVFTWGTKENVIINPDTFRTNFYGYIYGK
jgi:hypothetical protein